MMPPTCRGAAPRSRGASPPSRAAEPAVPGRDGVDAPGRDARIVCRSSTACAHLALEEVIFVRRRLLLRVEESLVVAAADAEAAVGTPGPAAHSFW